MARLPKPGSDSGTWGSLLNDFLSVELNSDGTLKKAGDIAAAASNDSVVHNSGDETVGGIKTFASSPLVPNPTTSTAATNKAYVDSTVSAGAPDASTTTKGIVRLTGDLGGTAALPTVPGLATKEPFVTAGTTAQYYRGDKSFQTLDKGAVGLANIDNTSDTNKPVSSATTTALNLKIDKSTATTKGDLLAATAASTIARLGVGTDGQILTADAASAPGVKWAAAPTAPVTSVVGQTGIITGAQIAADGALTSTYAAAGIGASFAPATKAYARLATPGTAQRLRWASLGDSVAYLKMRWMAARLNRAFGSPSGGSVSSAIEAGQSGTGWAISGNTVNSTTGTVTDALGDFDAWFSGRVARFSTASSRTYGSGGGLATWDTVKVYYVKGSGALDAGTFKIQIDGVDETGFTNISTVSGTQNIGIATITRGSVATRLLGIINLTGSHRIVGVSFEASTYGGLMHAGISQGGISLANATGTAGACAALTTFMTDFAPDVISIEAKESSSDWSTSLGILLPLLRAACPTATIIGIGTTPMASGDADNVLQNTQLKAACIANGCSYWDGYTPVVSYANLVALGWQGDGIHVDDKCSSFLAGLLLRDLGILSHSGVSESRDINTTNAYLSGNVGIGTQSPTQLLDVVAGTSGNATVSIRNTGTTGQVATLNLISGFSGTQGNSSIQATAAELRLNASTIGGVGNSFVSLYAGGAERARILGTGGIRIAAAGATHFSGTGVPTIAGTAGDWFWRTDTPTVANQRAYICTVTGAAGVATWVGVI